MTKLSFQEAAEKRALLEAAVQELETTIMSQTEALLQARRDLYETSLRELHMKEIYRLAKIEIPRLRREPPGHLTEADVHELEKWIAREKTIEGLGRVADAMKEVQKYKPVSIRSNLYALIQKIIIEGAYKGKK